MKKITKCAFFLFKWVSIIGVMLLLDIALLAIFAGEGTKGLFELFA